MNIYEWIERKDIDLSLSRNFFIKEVESKFLKIKKSNYFWFDDKEEINLYFNHYISSAELNDNKLNSSSAKNLATILYLNNKEFYQEMIVDFLFEEKDLIDLIYQIEKSDEYNSKEIVDSLVWLIEDWCFLYLDKKAKLYENIDWLIKNIKKEKCIS